MTNEKSTPDARRWQGTKFPGVQSRAHATRKHGVGPDRYFRIRYKVEGKLKTEGMGWSSEGWSAARAAETLAEIKRNIREGDGPFSLAEKRSEEMQRREAEEKARRQAEWEAITFGEVFEKHYWPVQEANKKQASLATERGFFYKWLAPSIGKKPMAKVSPLDLERIKKKMADAGKAPRTVDYMLALVRQVYNFAADHSIISCVSPTRKVKAPKVDNRRMRFLTVDEARQLLDALQERSLDLHDQALLALGCGLRAGEVFNLTWGDVDLARGILFLRDTKSGRNRAAYMTQAVKAMLTQRGGGEPAAYVFTNRKGQQVKEVSRTFERVVESLGFNDGVEDRRYRVCFHSLRHSFASWLAESGTDLYRIKELMGHADLSQTQRYSHLLPDSLREAVAAMDARTSQLEDEEEENVTAGQKVINLLD